MAVEAAARAPARRLPLLAHRPEVLPLVAVALAWAVALRGGGAHGLAGGHLAHARSIVVMVVATMGLFAVPVVRTVASTSPWWRARRAVVIAFATFVGTWFVVALGLHVVAELLTPGIVSARALAAVASAVGAVLVLRPGRARRVVRCGRPVPLHRDGRAADADCARSGVLAARWCARLSAVPMLAMVAVPGRLWLMAGLTVLAVGERLWAPRGRIAIALGYAAVGVAVLL